MKNKDIALEYLKCFCNGDIEGLHPLLAHDLTFAGPFHSFGSSLEYLDSLRKDPPENCQYNILSITENVDSVAVFYDYHKSDHTIRIAQLLTIANQEIKDIVLVFDTSALA